MPVRAGGIGNMAQPKIRLMTAEEMYQYAARFHEFFHAQVYPDGPREWEIVVEEIEATTHRIRKRIAGLRSGKGRKRDASGRYL